ncbi:MAG: hypothetical protein ACM30E_07140 [Nitrososphaerales archaeon]
MKSHEAIERILASYRDASAEERARVDAHVACCPACAARRAAFDEVDATLMGLAQPALPARLAKPLATVIAAQDRPSISTHASRFAMTGTLAPAAIVLVVLAALSVIMWSLNSGRPPVTATPTLTMTLTPTTISARQTEPAALTGLVSVRPVVAQRAPSVEPTPAPVPAPTAGIGRVLLAGYGPHATIIH